MTKELRFETRAIHAGQPPEPATGAVVVPIYQTSTYVQDDLGVHKGYEYSRTGNPTRTALEQCLASLENGKHGIAFASGMAATSTLMYLLKPGDHVLVGNDVYGGTYRLFQHILTDYGLAFTYVDTTDLDAVRHAIRPETRMIWIETPTNPWLRIVDIAGIADIARTTSHNSQSEIRNPQSAICTVVDNTFASPYLQRPLDLGADIVLHSTTKYLGGHSDVVGGAIVTSDDEVAERLYFLQNAAGAVPGPFDAWLVLRGVKTLGVRMRAHCENARAVADFLTGHPKVEQVLYPGLPTHPGHEIARRQMDDFGGMVSFTVKGGAEAARRVARSTRLFFLAESLGGVESLIEAPAVMTHASVAGSPLEVPANLIRLSVGIEHVEDLIADLDQALQAA
ncbi:MAG: cystathionine gamma-synthase [Anaerolineae bacterium]